MTDTILCTAVIDKPALRCLTPVIGWTTSDERNSDMIVENHGDRAEVHRRGFQVCAYHSSRFLPKGSCVGFSFLLIPINQRLCICPLDIVLHLNAKW